MKKLKEDTFLFIVGGILYSLMEISFRGFTHWTMTLTGGVCLVLMYRADMKFEKARLWQKCLMGSVIITTLEFIVGCIDNIAFNWDVWDYSKTPFNFMGQICLPFSIIWFVISAPVAYFCKYIKIRIFDRKMLMQN